MLALLTAASLAGCIASPPGAPAQAPGDGRAADWRELLTEPRFEETTHEQMRVEGHDGTELHVDVYRPEVPQDADEAEDGVPVILVYSPYFGLSKSLTDQHRPGGTLGWMIDHFVPRGYAVAMADARGSRRSGGCIEVAGPEEIQDGAAVVEALAGADWSAGKVGMFGVSYPARTQYGIATLDPDGLETIVPVAGISDYYTYFYFHGVPRRGNNPGTMAGYHAISLLPDPSPEGVTAYPERPTCIPENMEHGLDMSGAWDDYWAARDYNAQAGNVDASLWLIHGFEDWNVISRSAVEYYQRVDVFKRAWLFQMEHNYPDDNSHNEDWSRTDFRDQLHRWFDHELSGIDNGLADEPAVEVQDSTGRWRAAATWPPAETSPVRLHLAPDGTLTDDPAKEGTRSYMAVPETWRQGDLRQRARLVYETDPLQAPLHFAGAPRLDLNVTLDDGESTHLAWRLEAVEDGQATLLTRGYLDTRYRDGVRNGAEPVAPGQTVALTLTSHPQDDVVPAGAKIRLVLSPDDPSMHGDTSRGAATQVTVHHGGETSGTVVFPTVEVAEDEVLDPPMGSS